MKTANLMKIIMMVSLIALLSSCSKDKDDAKNKTGIKFQSTWSKPKTAELKNTLADGLVLESFKINIAEIELEFDDDDPLFNDTSYETEYEFKGPFEIELIRDGNPFEVIIINDVDLPNAAYDEIEFEFDKNKNPNSAIYGKTMVIKGAIDGVPFIYWTDKELEMEIEFDELVHVDDVHNALLTVSFDLDALFNPSFGGIDITSAKDGNGDGLIEIYKNDPDGNSDLSGSIWNRIKHIIKAFEDKYDD